MRKTAFFLLCILLLIGGCSNKENVKSNEDNFPKTEAFRDPFTRDFIVSPKEIEDGFYLVKSGTDGFTMLFPVNIRMEKASVFHLSNS